MVYRATVQIGREKPMPSKSIGKHLPARDPAIEGTDRADPKRLYDSLLGYSLLALRGVFQRFVINDMVELTSW